MMPLPNCWLSAFVRHPLRVGGEGVALWASDGVGVHSGILLDFSSVILVF